jgi:hypothetical protein
VVTAPAIKSTVKTIKKTMNKRSNDLASDSDDDNSSSDAGDGVAQDSDASVSFEDDDGPEYEDLSKKELFKLNRELKQCIGRKFCDSEDGNEGVVISIVRELKSNELCFKYFTSNADLQDDEYMWVSSLADDSITWEDVDDYNEDTHFSSTTNHSNTANAKKARPTSSWIYETSLGKSIFEDTVIPAGAKRGGRS